MSHCITNTTAQEKGYKYMDGHIKPIHREMEDVHWAGSAAGARVFILADGHGGAGAAHYFVKSISILVIQLLDSKDWDLSQPKDRTEIQESLQDIFIAVDNDYTRIKYHEFSDWFSQQQQQSQQYLKNKPEDDGCTFVLNIVYKGFLLNANVGDSRTVLGIKSKYDYSLVFSSVDHNTTNPDKVKDIIHNGGKFLNQKGTISNVNDKDSSYSHLSGARIYRHPTLISNGIGLSHRRTLNLTGSMGDIHFKLYPPVLSCVPDISIFKLDETQEYLLIAATDGVWDHLIASPDYDMQNSTVLDFAFSVLADDEDILDVGLPTPSDSETFDDACDNPLISDKRLPTPSPAASTDFDTVCKTPDFTLMNERLKYASQCLVKRENSQTSANLFYEFLHRYDDATAQIIHLAPY